MDNTRKLYRSNTDIKIGGICAGIAEHLNVDPMLIRVIYAVISVFMGIIGGFILYLILLWIIPVKEGTNP